MEELFTEMAGVEAPAFIVPEGDRTPEEWANWCNEPRGKAVENIVEWGRRIKVAHSAYKQQPKRWGQQWESWSQQNLGIGRSMVTRLEAIGENLLIDNQQILPPNTDSLYALARIKRNTPEVFDTALKEGIIHPDMSRTEVKELLQQHTKPQRFPAEAADIIPVPGSGTVWRLGDHLLYCADSSTWESPLDGNFRMAFADPPYGLTSAHWDTELYWEHDWLADVADFVFVTPGIRNTKRFQPAMPYQWTLTYWMSNSMTHGPVGFSNVQHIELYSRRDSVKVGIGDWFKDEMGSGTVDASESRGHRGQKPISMLLWLIEKFTEPGDWVLDPFLGSGTTLLAAERLGRKCIGIEKDPDYCQQIIAAWQRQTGAHAQPFAEFA